MKKTISTYIYTILLFFIPFVLISFILATLSYFIQLSSLTLNIIIQVLSYALLIIAALFFTSRMNEKRLTHCLIFALLYFLLSLFMHLGNIHYVHLFLKPLLFVFIGLYKELVIKN